MNVSVCSVIQLSMNYREYIKAVRMEFKLTIKHQLKYYTVKFLNLSKCIIKGNEFYNMDNAAHSIDSLENLIAEANKFHNIKNSSLVISHSKGVINNIEK